MENSQCRGADEAILYKTSSELAKNLGVQRDLLADQARGRMRLSAPLHPANKRRKGDIGI